MANARELLAQFMVGVDTSQLVRADQMISAIAQRSGALGSLGGQSLNVGVDARGLEGFDGLVDRAKDALLGFVTVEGISEMASQFSSLIEEGGKLNDLSDKLGVSTDDLQKFSYAVGLSGVEADAAYSALGKLSRNLGEGLSGGKEQAKAFAELGVSIKDASGNARPLIDVASDIADQVKGAGSEAEAAAKLTGVFGKAGADLIPAFKGGGAALKDLAEEFDALGGGMSQDFVKQADDVGDQLDKLKLSSKNLKIQIASQLLPYANQFTKWAVDGAKKLVVLNKETNVLKVGMAGAGVAGAAVAAVNLTKAAKALGFVSKNASSAGDVIKGLFSFGLTGTLLIGGLILAGLLIEDFYTLLKGGDSEIGAFLDKTYGVGASAAFVKQLTDAWTELSTALGDQSLEPVVSALKEMAEGIIPSIISHFLNLVKTVTEFAKLLTSTINSIKELSKFASTIETDPTKILKQLTLSGSAENPLLKQDAASQQARTSAGIGLGETASKFSDAIGGLFKGLSGKGSSEILGDAASGRTLQTLPTSGAGDQNVTQQNTIKIEVQGGPSNEDTASAVGQAVQRSAKFGMDSAVAATRRR